MIYLDYNSTTPVDERVLDVMLPYFRTEFGNAASSTHEMGRSARAAVELAREQIATAIGASVEEIIFTSGATESNNLAIRGVCTHRSFRSKTLLSSQLEHRAVTDPVNRLKREGVPVEILTSFETTGRLDSNTLSNSLVESGNVGLVTLMLANNEIGTLLDVKALAKAISSLPDRPLVHCDGAQAIGKIPVNVAQLPIDLISISGHKLYAPKGIGALYVRRGTRLKPIVDGGGHESGFRSGTLNVPGIVGMGKAVELATQSLEREVEHLNQLTKRFYQAFTTAVNGVQLNGPDLNHRLPGNLNFRIEGVNAEALALQLETVCISTGSACTSADPEPSHVLRGIGLSETEARSSIRISVGRMTTESEIDQAVTQIAAAINDLRTQA